MSERQPHGWAGIALESISISITSIRSKYIKYLKYYEYYKH